MTIWLDTSPLHKATWSNTADRDALLPYLDARLHLVPEGKRLAIAWQMQEHFIRTILPLVLRDAAKKDAASRESLMVAAARCEMEGSVDSVVAADIATYAAYTRRQAKEMARLHEAPDRTRAAWRATTESIWMAAGPHRKHSLANIVVPAAIGLVLTACSVMRPSPTITIAIGMGVLMVVLCTLNQFKNSLYALTMAREVSSIARYTTAIVKAVVLSSEAVGPHVLGVAVHAWDEIMDNAGVPTTYLIM